jgi:hypothetical protein
MMGGLATVALESSIASPFFVSAEGHAGKYSQKVA